jgi:putative flavoprotein involved in K+ transport
VVGAPRRRGDGLVRRAGRPGGGRYRGPDDVAPGGVLVVGASATGVQLAAELQAAGRDVVLAVGRHTRMPRLHRGMDIFWWLQRIGALDRPLDAMADPRAARDEPSLQLIGRPDRHSLDLWTLAAMGVRLAGRLVAADGGRVTFDDGLPDRLADADHRLGRLLDRIDAHISAEHLDGEVLARQPVPVVRATAPPATLDLHAAGIRTVLWATGHRRTYPWLQVPVLDGDGEIRNHRGITPVAGVYVLGQRFQHRRSSSFIGGVGLDARFVADHITADHMRRQEPSRALHR